MISVSETGELAQEILRDTGYGKQAITRVSDKAVAELGDSVFSLLSMANEMDVDIEEALAAAIERYGKRLEQDGVDSDHGQTQRDLAGYLSLTSTGRFGYGKSS